MTDPVLDDSTLTHIETHMTTESNTHIYMTMSDALEAQRRRNAGMAAAENGREWLLAQAQRCAREAAETYGEVHADDVAMHMSARGLDYSALGNAAGSVFKGMEWTGRVVRSERSSTHGRIIRVWRLK